MVRYQCIQGRMESYVHILWIYCKESEDKVHYCIIILRIMSVGDVCGTMRTAVSDMLA